MLWPFLKAFEVWAVARLLSSPAFHRGVGKVAKTVHRMRHGTPMEELGGTKLERKGPSLFQHFKDEIKEQLKIKDNDKQKRF